jgi:hypothetical protein
LTRNMGKMVVGGVFILLGMWWASPTPTSIAHAQYAPGSFSSCENTRSRTLYKGSTSGTAATQIVPLLSGAPIYVCSLTVIGTSGTTPTFSLVTGTGTNCASNQAVVLAAFTSTANTPVIWQEVFTETPAGYELCYLDGGTTPVQWYALTVAQG